MRLRRSDRLGEHFAGRVLQPPYTFFTTVPNGGGVIANDGECWRQQRRVSLRILRDFGMGKNLMEATILSAATELCRYLDTLEDKSSVNMSFPLEVGPSYLFTQRMLASALHRQRD